MIKKLLLLFLLPFSIIGAEEIIQEQPCCYYYPPLLTKLFATIKGGVAPTFFSSNNQLYAIDTLLPNPIFPLATITKFSQTWKQPPFTFGIDLGYGLCSNVELFGEFNFLRATDHHTTLSVEYPNNNAACWNITFSPFQTLAGFVGLRGYSRRYLHNRVTFFFGTKFGMINHKKIMLQPLTIDLGSNNIVTENILYFDTTNAVAGGLQIGLDAYLGRCISLFINAEAVASAGLKSQQNITTTNTIFGINNYIHNGTGTIINFPINIGFRYYFG